MADNIYDILALEEANKSYEERLRGNTSAAVAHQNQRLRLGELSHNAYAQEQAQREAEARASAENFDRELDAESAALRRRNANSRNPTAAEKKVCHLLLDDLVWCDPEIMAHKVESVHGDPMFNIPLDLRASAWKAMESLALRGKKPVCPNCRSRAFHNYGRE